MGYDAYKCHAFPICVAYPTNGSQPHLEAKMATVTVVVDGAMMGEQFACSVYGNAPSFLPSSYVHSSYIHVAYRIGGSMMCGQQMTSDWLCILYAGGIVRQRIC